MAKTPAVHTARPTQRANGLMLVSTLRVAAIDPMVMPFTYSKKVNWESCFLPRMRVRIASVRKLMRLRMATTKGSFRACHPLVVKLPSTPKGNSVKELAGGPTLRENAPQIIRQQEAVLTRPYRS